MHLLIGDVQGCAGPLARLLDEVGFSPSRDTLHVLGDLVNRGPDSRGALALLAGLGGAARCLLGNHDLHLLAAAAGARRPSRSDTFGDVLGDPQRERWLDWLRGCRLADRAHGWLLVHAGVAPQWSADDALAHAAEVERVIAAPGSADAAAFFAAMYGSAPARWDDALAGPARWKFIVDALTRMRFCRADGTLDFETKESADEAPEGLVPWFDMPGRRTAGVPVAFGHWSTLGLVMRDDLLALDTGCVWGGRLTAVRIDGGRRDVHHVRCPQSQRPGVDS